MPRRAAGEVPAGWDQAPPGILGHGIKQNSYLIHKVRYWKRGAMWPYNIDQAIWHCGNGSYSGATFVAEIPVAYGKQWALCPKCHQKDP